jgi:hypothetical protein
MYLALLEKTPFLALGRLRALLVVAPLNGISHGRHFEREARCSACTGMKRRLELEFTNFGLQSITGGKLARLGLVYALLVALHPHLQCDTFTLLLHICRAC